mmetsp:Transcript_3366/g.8317  ORF Transcript_3366/g.8317 Transcript_3366/m.8317 type:complete len:178 (-) Transcript_3366:115-648(-)
MAAPHPSTQGRRGSEREAPECGYPAIAASLTCTSQLPCSRAEAMRDGKVVVTFRNVGAAPALRQNKFKIDAEQPFQAVIVFLRKQLHTADTDSLVRARVPSRVPTLSRLVPHACPCPPCCARVHRIRGGRSRGRRTQFVYVNSAFAPSPDERIADVARCFHVDGVLNLNYCTTPAWG